MGISLYRLSDYKSYLNNIGIYYTKLNFHYDEIRYVEFYDLNNLVAASNISPNV